MSKILVKPRTKARTKTKRPPLYKVILLNDDSVMPPRLPCE
jgi:ATP-dependent Clp protease adapter protein ClpS